MAQKDIFGSTQVLLRACQQGELNIVELVIKYGAKLDCTDKDGATPLIIAVFKGYFEIVNYLVAQGTTIETKNNKGDTPLLVASHKGHFVIVKYLIEQKASLEATNSRGSTALLQASKKGHLNIVKLLLQHGANFHHKDEKGRTALELAKLKDHSDIVTYLKHFQKPLPAHIPLESDSYVIVRVWSPTFNKKKTFLPLALAARPVADTDVGHVSLAIYQKGQLVAYISHWPYPHAPSSFGKSPGFNKTVADDMASEEAMPFIHVVLYSLDIDKMLSHYQKIKPKAKWGLWGSTFKTNNISEDKEEITHSCSSLAYSVLEQGGLFNHLLAESDRLKNPIAPMAVGELAQKARAVEDILCSETKEFARDALLTYKNELMEHARGNYNDLIQFLKSGPDLLWLYARHYGAQGMQALVQALEITLKRANAYSLFMDVKTANEQSAIFEGSNLLGIIKEKITGHRLDLKGLLAMLGYADRMITQEEHLFKTLIKPALATLIHVANQSTDLSWRDESGYTALHWTVMNNSPKILNLLLSHFPQAVNQRMGYQEIQQKVGPQSAMLDQKATAQPLTPLDLAYELQLPEMVKILRDNGGLTQSELKQQSHQQEPNYTQLLTQVRARSTLSLSSTPVLSEQGHDVPAISDNDNNNSNRCDPIYRNT